MAMKGKFQLVIVLLFCTLHTHLTWFTDVGARNWTDLLNTCCHEQSDSRCFFTDSRDCKCPQKLMSNWPHILSFFYMWYVRTVRMMDELNHGLDLYNIHARCPGGLIATPNAKVFHYPVMSHKFQTISVTQSTGSIFLGNEPTEVPFGNLTSIHNYLNKESVRSQLHINEAYAGYWGMCSSRIATQHKRQYFDLSEQYTLLLRAKVSVLFYYGDLDVIYDHIGSKWFVNGLGAKVEEQTHRLYYVEGDFMTQNGGFKKVFGVDGTELWHVTVRGSGHRVSEEQAALVYELVEHFVAAQTAE